MRILIALITTIIVISSNAQAYDNWCPNASEINYRAILAADNLDFLEQEVHYFNSNRRRIIYQIQGLRGFINNLINITDFDGNDCYNIQAHFYRADRRLRNLSRVINRRVLRNSRAPIRASWDTFVRSFIELENAVINLDAGYRFPRGPFYRRYFPSYRRFFPVVRLGRRIIRNNRRVRINRRPRLERRERRLDRRERRLERRERRFNRRSYRRNPNRNPNRNINSNPNRNPNRNINSNPNRNPNSNPGTRSNSRRNRRSGN